MKKLAFCIGFVALAAGFSGYADEASEEYGMRGVVQGVDEEARTVIIDGETYGFALNFAGTPIREIICGDCKVSYRLTNGAISQVTNNPTMSWEEEAEINTEERK